MWRSRARIAAISGRNVIGIELPNMARETVYLREMLAAPITKRRGALPLALGKTIGGEPVMADLAKMPHLVDRRHHRLGQIRRAQYDDLVAALSHGAASICRMIMIDPKMLELSVYEASRIFCRPSSPSRRKRLWRCNGRCARWRSATAKCPSSACAGGSVQRAGARSAKEKGENVKRTVQTGFDRAKYRQADL